MSHRVCIHCRRRKLRKDFSPNKHASAGVDHVCKRCRADARRLNPRPTDMLCIDCRKVRVRRCARCFACQTAHQNIVEANAKPLGPAPTVCGIPIRGGWCQNALQWGVDRIGYTTCWCIVHGEREMPRNVVPPSEPKPQRKHIPHKTEAA